MNKKKKCPYCGKRVSYTSAFGSRRKAEYVCPRCEKESRVVINKKVILAFIICAIISVGIMVLWLYLQLASNPLGIILVAIPLIIFGILSPKFVSFEPLKKYKKSMEAKKAGITYSDNLMISELDEETSSSSFDNSGQFRINSEIFNQIKADRTAAKEQLAENELVSNSAELKKEDVEKPYVHVIDDIRENHSVTSAPLKKIHSEGTRINRRHYIEETVEETADDSDVKEYKKTPTKNRYSANRKF